MVDSQEMRDAFAKRLNEALDDVPSVRRGRGRNVDFHAAIAKIGIALKTQATHKWLRGEAKPSDPHMQVLAEWLGVRTEWLAHGRGAKDLAADFEEILFSGSHLYQGSPRYRDASYERASEAHKRAVDDVAAKMLGMSEDQALKLKQAMELLSQANDPAQN
ncbi:hypothetical protein [Ectopseudomonas hydrolytica]|uniref:hypothetical protein n=1 Tax=Ectopseudomonas hydrolytica TaxID=2493633 RepID=UPI00376ECC45